MTRRTIELVALLAALLTAALAMHAWFASRDEQQNLQSTLAAQKQVLDAADARERGRNNTLGDTLAKIEELKRATQTPEQILRDLSKYLSLPQPITLVQPQPATGSLANGVPPVTISIAESSPKSRPAAQQGTPASGKPPTAPEVASEDSASPQFG